MRKFLNTKVFLFILIIIISSCDNKFKAEKTYSKTNEENYYVLYLISNISYNREIRYKILLDFIKKTDFSEIDTSITSYTVVFYRDCYCTRNYIERINKLEKSESLVERCEDEYCGSFDYKKSKHNPKIMYLTFPKDFKDTIFIK